MTMVTTARRLFRPLLYFAAGTTVTGGIMYWANRPRTIPGSDRAAVPPPSVGMSGSFRPPRFPLVKSRADQLMDLKRSALDSPHTVSTSNEVSKVPVVVDEADTDIYDLLIIGGGATGSGIALDAVTRGLKVALIERDDFGSGTSSKSTKLVHGGVRYLEKAFWELDYNQ